jgi:restriction endonuclease Mrr
MEELASELFENIKNCSPSFFERLVVELLVEMGYGGSIKEAGQAIGRTGDEGVDGVIKEDPLGLDQIYIQAKKWNGTIGRPEIQKFAGALQGQRAKIRIFNLVPIKFSHIPFVPLPTIYCYFIIKLYFLNVFACSVKNGSVQE